MTWATPVGCGAAAAPIDAALTARRFVALRRRSPVSIWREACLRLGSRHASCRACADICPSRALRAAPQSLDLGPDCSGCGRCEAVCPTGALSVEGFAALDRPGFFERERRSDRDRESGSGSEDALRLDCWQVPPELPNRGEIRVPCLGGVSAGRLLALCAAADPRPVVLADRGACADCASGGAEHPARQTLEHVASLMRQAGVPESKLPRLERQPLGGDHARCAHADPLLARGQSRRAFFLAQAGRIEEAPAPSPVARSRPQRSVERQRTLEALQVLVGRYRGCMPAALFHRVEVAASCRGHRVCAAACPTGALLRYRDPGTGMSGVAFDSSSCIACGHCAEVCPQHAIAIHRGAGVVAQGFRRLNRFRERECADCGTRFVLQDGEDETRCRNCRKSVQLAHAAFRTLFGARPAASGRT
jgi:ferredoxin